MVQLGLFSPRSIRVALWCTELILSPLACVLAVLLVLLAVLPARGTYCVECAAFSNCVHVEFVKLQARAGYQFIGDEPMHVAVGARVVAADPQAASCRRGDARPPRGARARQGAP